jgi:hypothetical protein
MMIAVTELRARPVDPRDTRWEVWNPAFRVYFWRSLGGGWMSREFEISGGDVVAVLAWAADHAEDDETYTLHCIVEGPDGAGLVRLTGEDPTRT